MKSSLDSRSCQQRKRSGALMVSVCCLAFAGSSVAHVPDHCADDLSAALAGSVSAREHADKLAAALAEAGFTRSEVSSELWEAFKDVALNKGVLVKALRCANSD